MVKVFLLLLVVFAGGVLVGKKYGYQEGFTAHAQLPQVESKAAFLDTPEEYLAPINAEPVHNEPLKTAFECDGRQHCSEMRSLAEAEFFLANCPQVQMDGDNDGRPCERQF
jgi:hypothetical protein